MNPDSNMPAQDKSFFTVNVIGGLIIGLIIGFLIGAYYGKHANSNNLNMGKVDINATSSMEAASSSVSNFNEDLKAHQMAGTSTIKVGDTKAGNTLILESVTLDHSYWIAVRDSASETKTPYILGARRMQAGDYKNVLIALSRNTVAGKKYDVVLYKDNGGAFNYDSSNLIGVSDTSAALATFDAK